MKYIKNELDAIYSVFMLQQNFSNNRNISGKYFQATTSFMILKKSTVRIVDEATSIHCPEANL